MCSEWVKFVKRLLYDSLFLIFILSISIDSNPCTISIVIYGLLSNQEKLRVAG